MTFYLIFTYCLIALLSLFAIFDRRKSLCFNSGLVKQKRVNPKMNPSILMGLLWLLVILTIILVLGLRGVKTGDYDNYEELFDTINYGKTITHPEKSNFLFDWMCRIVFLLGGSLNAAFLVAAILTCVFFALGLRYCESSRFLFIALFLLSFQYFDLFNIVRQGITDAIGFYVICKELFNKNHQQKDGPLLVLLLIVSAFFHSTGWLFLLIYLFIKFYDGEHFFVFELIVLALVSLISTFLATSDSLSNILSSIFGATWRAGKYNVEMDIGAREIGEGILGIFVWAILRLKGTTKRDQWFAFLTWLFVLSRFMTTNFRIMYRVADCFIPFFLISLISLPTFFKSKPIKILILASAVCFYAVFFFFKIKGYLSFHGYKMVSIDDLFR